MRFLSTIDEGGIDLPLMEIDTWSVSQPEGRYSIEIQPIENEVVQMRRYYHAEVLPKIADHLATHKREAHEMVLQEFAPIIIYNGEEYQLRTSGFVGDNAKTLWKEYLDTVIREYRMRGANIQDAKTH